MSYLVTFIRIHLMSLCKKMAHVSAKSVGQVIGE